MLSIEDLHYQLPDELIAQTPTEPRDACRLLVLDRETVQIQHRRFFELTKLLDENCVLVRNNTRVLPARLFGQKETGGKCEVLLVRQLVSETPDRTTVWECLTKPGLKPGQELQFMDPGTQTALMKGKCLPLVDGSKYTRNVEFSCIEEYFYTTLFKIGHTPLPPYIASNFADEENIRQLYQTSFAQFTGSVAAPTAGLHFTPELDHKLSDRGVQILEVTLHVGLGTFLPVQPEQLEQKKLHQEVFALSSETAEQLNTAKQRGKKIIAVGTTTTRVLESCALDGKLVPQSGTTELFIQPGDLFQIIDGLITNFHVPKSSLLMLVSAFTSAPNTSHSFESFAKTSIAQAYQAAVTENYRFFSFGDAMLIW